MKNQCLAKTVSDCADTFVMILVFVYMEKGTMHRNLFIFSSDLSGMFGRK